MAVVIPNLGIAAEWRITPRLNLRETYTDNVRLAPSGQEQSEWITEIDPSVSVRASGARLQVQGTYTFNQRLYANNSDANGHNHALSANGNLDVWNRHLFLQGSASVRQQNTSPFGVQTTSNASLSGNRSEVRVFNLSPYWISRLGNWANVQARYSLTRTESDGATSSLSSESQALSLGLSSGPVFNDFGWSASYSRQQTESTDNAFSRRDLETASLSARYRVLPTIAVTGSVGTEHNSYESTRGTSSGSFWNAGVDWAPSSRTRVGATVGERGFGRTKSLDGSHRTRLTTWTVKYTEQIVATPALFSVPFNINTAAILDALFLAEFPDPIQRQLAIQAFIVANGLPENFVTAVDFLTNQVSLSKSLTASVGIRGARSSLVLTVFRNDRSNESGSVSTLGGFDPFAESNRVVQTGYSSALSWRFSERATGSAAISQSRSELSDTGREDINSTYRVGMSYQIQPKVRGAVDVRMIERTSNNSGLDIKEHAIIGSLSIAF